MGDLARILDDFPLGLSAAELEGHVTGSRSTLNRRLREELAQGSITTRGRGAAIRYIPPYHPGTGYIGEMLTRMLERSTRIQDPIQASFYLLTRLPYLQPFRDGNKRTSRAICNVPLLQAGLPPISFVDLGKQDYLVGLLAFYELGETRLIEKCFVDAYLKSQERLMSTRDRLTVVTSGQLVGQVLAIEGHLVVQRVGRSGNTVIHDLERLRGPVEIGRVVEIKYQDGIGHVVCKRKGFPIVDEAAGNGPLYAFEVTLRDGIRAWRDLPVEKGGSATGISIFETYEKLADPGKFMEEYRLVAVHVFRTV